MTLPAIGPGRALGPLVALAGAVFLASLAAGSVPLPALEILAALVGRGEGLAETLVWGLRLPRALAGFAVGGLLALAGALLQGLLRNPLADPYVLGISGGAAVAACAGLMAGLVVPWVQLAAAGGAFIALAVLFLLARHAFFVRDALAGEEATTTVLLTGVMIASFAAAVLSLLLSLAPDAQLRPMIFWLLGDLSASSQLGTAFGSLVALLLLAAAARQRAPALNLMLRGDVQAMTQGVEVERQRRALVVIAALATGIAVTLAGAVGFVGFVAPHLVRRLWGNEQRVLLPASVLAGGSLVMGADTLARTVVAPVQLPVGVVTALVGVPVFLWLLRHR